MDILHAYPDLAEALNTLCQTRRNEVLQEMVDNDGDYSELCRARTEASMILRDSLEDKYKFLEQYSDAVFAQECYELDAIYRQGFIDALNVLNERGMLR